MSIDRHNQHILLGCGSHSIIPFVSFDDSSNNLFVAFLEIIDLEELAGLWRPSSDGFKALWYVA